MKKEKVIGIDLGTTNSLVAIKEEGAIIVIPDYKGEKLLPSSILFKDGVWVIGHKSGISSIKRAMGKGLDEVQNTFLPFNLHSTSHNKMLYIDAFGQIINPIEASAMILKTLKQRAEDYTGCSVSKAVITVPAHFDDVARNATKEAARLAGLDVLRLINEPTAAAIAYGGDNFGKILIYDMGGGTFDISVLELQMGVMQVISTTGDNNLGGDDFDKVIMEKLDIHDKFLAKKIKETICKIGLWSDGQKTISLEEFENYTKHLIKRAEELVLSVLEDDIQVAILVGGATRMPLIKKSLKKFFGDNILDNMNPDESVAIGAAIQADALLSGPSSLLIDVVPLSLGIGLMGGMVEHIIAKNTPIPYSSKRTYTTQEDGQTGIQIHIVQGESQKISECRSIGFFELLQIPSMKAGQARVDVEFRLDADGILVVSAKEQLTGKEQEIMVKPSYGLTLEEMAKFIHIST
ncbi:Chaperone protein HscA [Candidatus Cyrtobacter comes]|uniref:Chaperone protein HscA n=1 Tax=Candidatus Cyrtobacter comes TaxID=675776 RepID=A0ABU5L839_9RICK|nr:Hsp70 family protein [Candidatus Cyrtobacter comes]MDZ5762284.1 Chaperone protein HscA [Candidatus Cyrtobacter comes]